MNVLITGGTGSLGHALTSELLKHNWPTKICIYSRGEHKQEEMARKFDDKRLRFFIGDVRDKDRLSLACESSSVIFHAAALKIVPTAEYNPFETVKTNIVGTQNLVWAALNSKYTGNYPKVIAVSTDKAVNPINLYGATKLCAEKIIVAANNIRGNYGPRFSVCRYGNVANSNGSVIPLFRKQIAEGKQLTITHDDMTRFYITLPQAVKFLIHCLDRMHGGEIFVPDMPAMYIKDLALTMMSDYPPEKQWCSVTGTRPGEKFDETIITQEESTNCVYDRKAGIYIINPTNQDKNNSEYLQLTYGAITSGNTRKMSSTEIKEQLNELGQ